MNLVPNKHLLLNVPFQSTKYRKKDLCVDNKVRETFRNVYCPTCGIEKCVYISTKKTTSFHDCKKCKACCNVLNIPFKDQKPTILLFGGDVTHCFARETSPDYEKPSPFLNKFLHQSQPSTSEPEPCKEKSSPIRDKRIRFLLVDDLSNIFFFSDQFFQFQPTVNQPNLFNLQSTYRKNHDLLSLQQRSPVDSQFWSRLCYYCSK